MGRRPASASIAADTQISEPPATVPEFSESALKTITLDSPIPGMNTDIDDNLLAGFVPELPDRESPTGRLEMWANEFENNNFGDGDEEDAEEEEGEEEELSPLEELERLKGLPEDEGFDEEGEDEAEDEGEQDPKAADKPTAPKSKEEALDPRVAAELQAIREASAAQVKALEAQLQQLNEANAKAEAARLRAEREAQLTTERGTKAVEIADRLREEYDGLEDIDPKAFNRLVQAELREWEQEAKGKIDAEMRQADEQRSAEALAQAKLAARDAEIKTFLSALPEGTRLLATKTTQGEGTWGDLIADIYRLGSDSGALDAPFPDFAKAMSVELQEIFESGRKRGIADATKRLTKGQSAPPPVTDRGGTGKTDTRPQSKGIFSPEGIKDYFRGQVTPNLFGDIASPSRKKR